jgi:hypothetical protein
VTLVVALPVPPIPRHVNVKLVKLVSTAVVVVPLAGWSPDQPPEAAQLVAFAVVQVSVEDAPLATLVGLALRLTVGNGNSETLAVALAVPPAPVQESLKLVAAVIAALVAVPERGLVPLQPADAGVAEAVQLVALVELHVSDVVLPLATLVGFAVSVTVGNGKIETLAVAIAVPPAPVQESVKLVAAVIAALVAVPERPLAPLHPADAGVAEAVQLVAFVELHVSDVVPPLATLVGVAVNDTVGGGAVPETVTVTV